MQTFQNISKEFSTGGKIMDKVFYDCSLKELKKIIKASETLATIDGSLRNLSVSVKGNFVDKKGNLVFLTTHFAEIKTDSITKSQFITAKVDGIFTSVKLTGTYKVMDVHVTF